MVKDHLKRLTIREAAKKLGACDKTVRRMIERGEIVAVKWLGQWRIREGELRRVLGA